jgi:peptidoglycan LD-endopeptidase LytH
MYRFLWSGYIAIVRPKSVLHFSPFFVYSSRMQMKPVKTNKRLSRRRVALILLLLVFISVILLPGEIQMPVSGAGSNSYNDQSFWFYPWGTSVTHKGVDIFAREGTPVVPAAPGIVVYTGVLGKGGNVLLILSSKWRFHYYAHLQEVRTKTFSYVISGDTIATVGATGNAKGKPPHLHYSIITPIPYFWLADDSRQGWKKMFYLDPTKYLE